MSSSFLFGISLTASFFAGVLALFAPCCITFLFPSYLGTIFKENRRVMFYTLVFAVGLGFVLVPIALGLRLAIFFLDAYHTQVYYLGAVIMLLMAVMTIKPIFHLPQIFHVSGSGVKKVNTASVFGLGLMSGLTSACCAPVLFAAVTLTSLAPTIFQAVIVSLAYITGIVMPLFVMSMFYQQATSRIAGQNRQKIYTGFKFFGAGIFLVTGIVIAVLNYQGKIVMNQMEPYSQTIRMTVFRIAKYFQNPILDIVVFGLICAGFYRLLKIAAKNAE